MRLNDVFSDWATGQGIFSYLQDYDVPWQKLDVNIQLDLEYHGNISGCKRLSPLACKMSEEAKGVESMAKTIYVLYNTIWSKQWETLSAEYNPIENYSMTEVMNDDITTIKYGKNSTQTNDLTYKKTGTDDIKSGGSDVTIPEVTVNTEHDVFGFNSTDAVPSDTGVQTSGGKNTVTHDNDDTHTYNLNDTNEGTVTHEDSGQDTHEHSYNLTRSGNIGVTTSQQMLESERKLWTWNFYREVVFPDIDKVLTIGIY